jgi:hypothetical protein
MCTYVNMRGGQTKSASVLRFYKTSNKSIYDKVQYFVTYIHIHFSITNQVLITKSKSNLPNVLVCVLCLFVSLSELIMVTNVTNMIYICIYIIYYACT